MSAAAVSAARRSPEPGIERSRIVQSGRLATMPYQAALAWQQQRAEAVAVGALPEVIVLLEHEPVYTQGRRGGRDHVLTELSAPVVDTDRGGDVTFHGPGQLVVWPILRLRERGIGIAAYVRGLEEAAMQAALDLGLKPERVSGRPGVWLGNRKLASVGVRLQSGVSRHGLALNCDVELSWFDGIRACGIDRATTTSLTAELGRTVTVSECVPLVRDALATVFGLRLSPVQCLGEEQ
ncbi:MAG: lipoyl(octanoyl) transferase LipB [Chloroflexi bacterium]|nr:lipoyl(octanoyl) transferase LipB [Chloroflexota bacterium]MYF21439.1 lipoyl(octanoyl) transferase LipB [Chloroflexota bacterium]